MLALFRIDFRLLHYQTSQIWPNKLNVNMIVVANDETARDPLRKSLMKMGASSNTDLKILTVDRAIAYLNDPISHNRRIELLVDSPKDALRVLDGVEGIKHLNVALMKGGPGKTMVCPSLGLSPEDFTDLQAIIDRGVLAEVYVTPDERPVSITKYL